MSHSAISMPESTPITDVSGRSVKPGAVDLPPQGLDVERVHAHDMPLEHVGDHRLDHLRPEGVAIDLADAGDAVVGRELDEDEVAAAEARRRIADDEGLEVLDFHERPPGRYSTLSIRSAQESERARIGAGPSSRLRDRVIDQANHQREKA